MGLFPSASAAWVISEEEFMKQFPVIDNLKFRIGYGLAGNQSGIDSYTTLNLVKPNGVVPVGNSAIVSLGDLRNTNPDLKWEVKHTFNTGFRYRFIRQPPVAFRQLLQLPHHGYALPLQRKRAPFTYNTLLANIGSMRNWGTEIAIGITPLKTKDMELNINANITFQRNKLLSLSGMYNGEMLSASEYKSLASLDGAGFHGGYNHIVYQMVGQPLGVFYLPSQHRTGVRRKRWIYLWHCRPEMAEASVWKMVKTATWQDKPYPKRFWDLTSVSVTSVSTCLCKSTELSDIKSTTELP